MNQLLLGQIKLVEQFVFMSKRLRESEKMNQSYKYTTLKDTRRFIRDNSRPVLTFDEALKQVQDDDF